MSVPRVHLTITCANQHVHQILTGFILLSRAGEVHLTTRLLSRAESPYPFLAHATIDGARVVYDLQDGVLVPDTEENDRIFRDADVLFARGYVPGSYGSWEDKVVPLGLNYYVTIADPVSLRARMSAPPRSLARSIAGRVTRRRPAADISTFERAPDADGTHRDRIVFATRVWDPQVEIPHGAAEAVQQVNDWRAEAVRVLRDAFGPRFWGGVSPTRYAVDHYADVVADRRSVGQRSYLAAVRSSAVCVTTTGLGGSNPWKLAEFVAGSRPIVAERLTQEVPGPFADGSNFLAFETLGEMAEAAATLLDDGDRRADMAHHNWDYYRDYVRPDALVRRTVAVVGDRRLAASDRPPAASS